MANMKKMLMGAGMTVGVALVTVLGGAWVGEKVLGPVGAIAGGVTVGGLIGMVAIAVVLKEYVLKK
jgi:hypothetical protein